MSRKRRHHTKRVRETGPNEPIDALSPPPPEATRPPSGKRNAVLGVAVVVGVMLGLFVVFRYQKRSLYQADEALRSGRPEYAEMLLARFLLEHPNHPQAMALQARTLVELKTPNPEGALKLFDLVGTASPEEEHARAKALIMLGKRSAAVPHLQLVLEEQPNNADAWHELTAILIQLGDLRGALTTAKKYVVLPGQEAKGRLFLGAIYTDLHNYELAVVEFAKLLENDPDVASLNVDAWEFFQMYGEVLLESNQEEPAIATLRRALELRRASDRTVSARLWFLIGKAEDAGGHPEEAQRAWESALRIDPQHLEACEQLAKQAIADRDFQKSLTLLKPVENHSELASSTAFLLQRTYSLLEDTETADRWETRAAELRKSESRATVIAKYLTDNPNSFWGQAMRAHQFAQQGNRYEATRIVARLVKHEDFRNEPFVSALAAALQDPSRPLPSTDLIPIDSF